MSDLEREIARWRAELAHTRALAPSDLDEMENHLREEAADLQTTGLSETEAFLVARHRLGRTEALATEFHKVNTEWNSLQRLSWMALGAFVYLVSSYVVAGIWSAGTAAASRYGATGYTMIALSIITKTILIVAAFGLFWVIGRLWLQTEFGRRWPACSAPRLGILCAALVIADLILIASQLLFRMAALQKLGMRESGPLSMTSTYLGLTWTFIAPILVAFLVIAFRAHALRRRGTGTACPSE